MIKKVNIYVTIIKICLDFLTIFIAFFIARKIRLITDLIPNITLPIQTIAINDLIQFALIGSTVLIIIFLGHGLYKIDESIGRIKEYSKILLYSFYSFVFFNVIVFLGQGFLFNIEIPRLIILYTFLLGSIFIIIERYILSLVKIYLFKKGFISKTKIFIINNRKCKKSIELIKSFKNSFDYELVGISDQIDINIKNIKKYDFNKLKIIISKRKIDEILYINSKYDDEKILELWKLTRIFSIKYRYIANSFDLAKSNTSMSLVNNIPALEIKNTAIVGWNSIYKRLFDIFFGIIGLIIFTPIIVIVSILIKIEDKDGPIIFKNKRIGRDGKEFILYKFRYMKWKHCIKDSYKVSKKEKEEVLKYEELLINKHSTRKGPLYKIKNDPRKTKIGTFIEKYSIDEIPQFLNIIIGNMSLIGPRPHQGREVDKYLLEHNRLLTIKPGITGMSQVNGRETNTFEDEANLDIYYIENWSILLDLKILLKTIYVILTR